MEPLTEGVQQLVLLTCGSMFLAWFALAVGEFLTRFLISVLMHWIE